MTAQNLQCVIYWADFAIWSLPARYDYLNEQNLSTLKLAIYIVLWKRPFRIPVNTKHTAVYQVSPLCSASLWSFVPALNSWTQNCRKSQILRLPKVLRLKRELQARYVTRRYRSVHLAVVYNAYVGNFYVAMLLRWIWGREAIVDIARYVNNLKFSLEFLT